MPMLTAYADESGRPEDAKCRVISMGSVIGTTGSWQQFRKRWPKLCAKHNIPYLHMKEIIGARHTRKGVFARFLDPLLLKDLLMDAVSEADYCGLFGCGIAVWVDDLKSSLKQHRLTVDPYSFTLNVSTTLLGTWALNEFPHDPSFNMVLDRVEKGYAKVAQAKGMYKTDKHNFWRGWPDITAINKNDQRGSKQIFELQIADLVAWLTRNFAVNMEEWIRKEKPKLRDQERWLESVGPWFIDKCHKQAAYDPMYLVFNQVFSKLSYIERLKWFILDRERIENMVMVGRNIEYDRMLVARSVEQAGRHFPLTPQPFIQIGEPSV